MKRMRNGLLMILIMALVMPAPGVNASQSPGGDSTSPATSVAVAPPSTPSAESPAPSGDMSSPAPAADGSAAPVAGGVVTHAASPTPPAVEPAKLPIAADPEPQQPPTPPASQPTPDPSTPTSPSPPAPPVVSGRLIISKLNPDEPEIIELFNPESHAVDLADARIEFVPRDKTPVLLKRFESGSVPAQGFITLGDESGVPFDVSTKNVISLSGTIRLVLRDYEEELAFGEGTALDAAGVRSGQRFMQRCQADQTTFVMTAFDATRLGTWPNCQQDLPPTAPPRNVCAGVRLSEIGAYTPYVLPEYELEPQEFLRISSLEAKLSLTKTSGTVYFLTSAGEEIDEVRYQKLAKGTSWALVDGEWRQTYAPTPGEANVFQRWQDCEEGKQINEVTGNCVNIPVPPAGPAACAPGYYRHPETGRCRKLATAKAPAPCKEGYYRSEATGRCRSIASVAAKTLKPCPDGEFRNLATGRCKKIAAASDVAKECPEGFERNPATNRCRKIQQTTPPKVDFAPEPAKEVAGAVWGWWVAGGAGVLALGYAAWEWRWELRRLLRRNG